MGSIGCVRGTACKSALLLLLLLLLFFSFCFISGMLSGTSAVKRSSFPAIPPQSKISSSFSDPTPTLYNVYIYIKDFTDSAN